MLILVIEGDEHFDDETQEFSTVGDVVLELEHSLVSLSKWESKHQKPFLEDNDKTSSEILDYIIFMIQNDYPPDALLRLEEKHMEQINKYIESPESATTFGDMPERKGRGERITSELIYYWMVAFQIPFECQDWHLNRLFALIRICNIKNQDPKKNRMSKGQIAQRNRDLNRQRREQMGTSG